MDTFTDPKNRYLDSSTSVEYDDVDYGRNEIIEEFASAQSVVGTETAFDFSNQVSNAPSVIIPTYEVGNDLQVNDELYYQSLDDQALLDAQSSADAGALQTKVGGPGSNMDSPQFTSLSSLGDGSLIDYGANTGMPVKNILNANQEGTYVPSSLADYNSVARYAPPAAGSALGGGIEILSSEGDLQQVDVREFDSLASQGVQIPIAPRIDPPPFDNDPFSSPF